MADNQNIQIDMLDPVTIDNNELAQYNGLPGFMRSDKKCVIMLALSTIPGARGNTSILLEDTRHEVDPALGTKTIYSGAYQLEAVSKYIVDKALQEGRTDVEFIILATTATIENRHEEPIYVVRKPDRDKGEQRTDSANGARGTHQLYQTNDGGILRSPTASELFRKRMLEYVAEIDPEGHLRVRFMEYPMTEDTRKDVQELMGLVRSETNDTVAPEIYIDIHGGPRPTQQLLINLLSILGEEGIHIDPNHILTVDGGTRPIMIAGEGFRINDFVAGIHEFTNYGRMGSLNRFYENRDKTPATANLLKTMNDISSAIQLCDMAWFDELLSDRPDALPQRLADFKNTDEGNSYLGAFLNLIERGYKQLLEWDAGTRRYNVTKDAIAEIEWCLDKGLYQQMLTICESRIPRYLIEEHSVLLFDDMLIQAANNQDRYEPNNWLFNNTFGTGRKKDGATRDNFDREQYKVGIDSVAGKACYRLIRNRPDGTANASNETDYSADIRRFLRTHYWLKELRNHSNHASAHGVRMTPDENDVQESQDPSMQHITDADLVKYIDQYLKQIDTLVKRENAVMQACQLQVTFEPKPDGPEIPDEYKDRYDELKRLSALLIDHAPAMNHQQAFSSCKLQRLYRLICIANDNPTDKLRAIHQNHCDTSLLLKIYEDEYAGVTDTDDRMRKILKKTSNSPFWRKIGNKIKNVAETGTTQRMINILDML